MQPLTDQEIKDRIKEYCKQQDECDLKDAKRVEGRILGLCESLGASENLISAGISRQLLESIGIKVIQVNPKWKFK